jgi:hypothetical protein
MPPPTVNPVTIDDKIINTINALGQLGIGALVIVCVFFAIIAFIIYLRVGAKSKENEARRDEENSKILLQFAAMTERADANREKAVDNRNSETAQAIEGMKDVLKAATETQRASNTALEQTAAAMEKNALYRREQFDATVALKAATLEQTDQLKAMSFDIREWPKMTNTALETLIRTVGDLNRSVGLLVANADSGVADRQELRAQLDTIKQIAETILEIARSNAALMTSITTGENNRPPGSYPTPDEGQKLLAEEKRKTDRFNVIQLDEPKE